VLGERVALQAIARWALVEVAAIRCLRRDEHEAGGAGVEHVGKLVLAALPRGHVSLMTFYPSGSGAGQHDDTWYSARTAVSEPDGRGVISYTSNYFSSVGISPANQYGDTCVPL
jgi:hypothetical protein